MIGKNMANISRTCMPYCLIPRTIPLSFDDSISYLEQICAMLHKINELIAQVNKNTEFIENWDKSIEELEQSVAELKEQVSTLSEDIAADVERRLAAFRVEVQSLIATLNVELRAYVQAREAYLQNEIDNVAIGRIRVFNPTTGQYDDLQNVINDLAGASREDSLTADEYDALDLTATAYDAYQISAYDYDYHGKSILV